MTNEIKSALNKHSGELKDFNLSIQASYGSFILEKALQENNGDYERSMAEFM